jgi:hypothetical protein
MSRRRKAARPADPAEIARRRAETRRLEADPEHWGADPNALRLPVNADVETRADLAGRPVRIQRQDVFDRLSARGGLSPHSLGAVRRLQEDMACLHRTMSGGVDFAPRVDCSRDPQAFGDTRRRAGARIEAALSLAGTVSARLLAALCEPAMVQGRVADWRVIVARETGETLADAQGAILRMACESLAGAYARLDRDRVAARRL